METKTCSVCQKDKPLECFRKEKRTKSGFQSRCLECERAYHKEYSLRPDTPAKKLAYRSKYVKLQREINKIEENRDIEKHCPGCDKTKPACDFNKAPERRGGLKSYCKQCDREDSRERLSVIKNSVFDKLGHQCVRCGFSDKRALQIDHINGGGNQEHRSFKNAMKYWKKVLSDTLGLYQVLCANCNWIKRSEKKEEPFYDRAISSPESELC